MPLLRNVKRIGVGLALLLAVVGGMVLFAAPGDLDLTFGGGDGYVTTNFFENDFHLAIDVVLDSSGRMVTAGQISGQLGTGGCCLYTGFIARYTADGTLDSTFGSSGVIFFPEPGEFCCSNSSFSELTIDASERILAVGQIEGKGGLIRLNPDGTLDTSFGDNGVVLDADPAFNQYTGLTLDGSGRILVVGERDNNLSFVARYLMDGTLDTSFGINGYTPLLTDTNLPCLSLLVDADGKILVCGRININDQSDLFLARYTGNGELDPGFGHNGVITLNVGEDDQAYRATLDHDGRILLVGSGGISSGSGNADLKPVLTRFLQDGTLDVTFGDNGVVVLNTGAQGYNEGYSLTLDAAGNIVLVGVLVDTSIVEPDGYSGLVARFLPGGTLDTTFGGGDGLVISNFDGNGILLADVVLDNNDKLVAVGQYLDMKVSVLVARYDSDSLPTDAPTQVPTDAVTDAPTEVPTDAVTDVPTEVPTDVVTDAPTDAPTEVTTEIATEAPTEVVTALPTVTPTATPTYPLPAIELLVNGGFEADDNIDTLEGWKLTMATKDKVKCGTWQKPVGYSGVCAFRFKGGMNEAAKLQQVPDLSVISPAGGGTVRLQFYAKATGVPNLKGKLHIVYSDNTIDGFTFDITVPEGTYEWFWASLGLQNKGIKKIKLQFRNRSTAGKVFVDAVSLTYDELNLTDSERRPVPGDRVPLP